MDIETIVLRIVEAAKLPFDPPTAHRVLDRLQKSLNGQNCQMDIARELNINSAHISRAVNDGYVSPMLIEATVAAGWFAAPPARVRWAADLPEHIRDEISADARWLNMTNGEFLEHLYMTWKTDAANVPQERNQ